MSLVKLVGYVPQQDRSEAQGGEKGQLSYGPHWQVGEEVEKGPKGETEAGGGTPFPPPPPPPASPEERSRVVVGEREEDGELFSALESPRGRDHLKEL